MATFEEILILDSKKSQLPHARKSKTVALRIDFVLKFSVTISC